MGRISQATRERIRERIDMVQLVSEYVSLERRGADDLWGRCPFHEEQSPSFHIRPSKGLFKCFGCGKGGDVFSFVEEVEGLSFPEALRRLAEKAGVALEPESPEERAREARLLELRRATALAAEFFQEVLWSATPAGERGRAYLAERGISPETAREFQLGVAPPEWDALATQLRQRGVVEQALLELGLVRARDGGRGVYDFFRDRFMFPIRDEQGKPCGFGGRTLCGDERKYMNSRELPGFYEKRRILYGLDMARKARPKRLVVVEGYMDVVLPHQAGRREFVAALGTAFTPEQAKLARRYVDEVVLLFDGDAAGAAATLRALANLVGHPGLTLKVARMPGDEDPDELVRRDPALLEQVLNGAEDVIAFLIRSALVGHDVGSPAGRERAIRAAISLLARITDLIRLNAELAAVADRFGLPETVLRQELDKARREQSKAKAPQRGGPGRGGRGEGPNPPGTPLSTQVADRAKAVQASEFELRLLEALLAVPHGAVKVKEQGASAEGFSAGPARRIAQAIFADAAEHGAVEPARVLGRLEDPEARALTGGLIAQLGAAAVGGKHKDHEGELAGLDRLMRSSWERRLRELKEEIRRAERRRDQSATTRLLEEHRDLKSRLAGGAKAIPAP